jgi:hypothetical protein
MVSCTVTDGMLSSNTVVSTIVVPSIPDMILRESTNGAFEVYDISHNAITSVGPMGQVCGRGAPPGDGCMAEGGTIR